MDQNLADIPGEVCVHSIEINVTSPGCGKIQNNTCQNVLDSPELAACVSMFDMTAYLDICEADNCGCSDSEDFNKFCVCSTLSQYSKQCALAHGMPGNWRNPQVCGIKCPQSMVYKECGSQCEKTCSNQEPVACQLNCVTGCFCPEGTVYDDVLDTGCIPVTECFCKYSGQVFPIGSELSLQCENCTCNNGLWSCDRKPCPGVCALKGASQIKTFDGRIYNFYGECTFILAKKCIDSTLEWFSVHAEVKPCHNNEYESCLVNVILITNTTRIVVTSSGTVLINNEDVNLPYHYGVLTVFEPSTFYIIVHADFGLQLEIQLEPIMQVYVYVANSYAGETCGLCGNFNHQQADDYIDSTGMAVQDLSAFVDSWRSINPCPPSSTEIIDPCSINIQKRAYAHMWCEKLTSKHEPFSVCHSLVNPRIYYERCLYETCLCRKSEDCLCAVFSDYVRACADHGIIIKDWRVDVCSKYTQECDTKAVYEYEVNTCQPTCKSLSVPDESCLVRFTTVDGCICKPGYFVNEDGQCVQQSHCSCYYMGKYYDAGDHVHRNGIDCDCRNGKITCDFSSLETTNCTAPMVYFNCSAQPADATGIECLQTCQTFYVDCFSNECLSGCVCPENMIADGRGGCVPNDQCTCMFNHVIYDHMASASIGCSICICNNGKWVCEEDISAPECTLYGDGNYITFDNKYYRFSGQCEYTLVQDYCGDHFENGTFRIVSENVQCSDTGLTCSKAITMYLMDFFLTFEDGDVVVSSVYEGIDSPFQIQNASLYLIIKASNGIVLVWDKKTSLTIKITNDFKNKVCGLCGNFDGNSNNDFNTRGHSTVEDVVEFGNSWKVSPSCPDVDDIAEPCDINLYRKSWAQRECSVLLSDTFKPCHSQEDPSNYYEACVKDSCACDEGGDCDCLCTAIAAYAQVCLSHCICVEWRTPRLCPVFCDYYNDKEDCEFHYDACGSGCLKTCRNPSGICTKDALLVEGCYPTCPPDKPYYEEFSMKCVEICGCYDQIGKYYNPGELIESCNICEICTCTTEGIICTYNVSACYCEYQGKIYQYNETIFSNNFGNGTCMTVVCGINGTINTNIYPCGSTTTATTELTSTRTAPTTTICVCHINGGLYYPGSEVTLDEHSAGYCAIVVKCNQNCIVTEEKIPCTTPTTTSSVFTTTSETTTQTTTTSTPSTTSETTTQTTTTSTPSTTSETTTQTTTTSTPSTTSETTTQTTTTSTPSTTSETTTQTTTTSTPSTTSETTTQTTTTSTPSTTSETTTQTTTTSTPSTTSETTTQTTTTSTPSTTSETTTQTTTTSTPSSTSETTTQTTTTSTPSTTSETTTQTTTTSTPSTTSETTTQTTTTSTPSTTSETTTQTTTTSTPSTTSETTTQTTTTSTPSTTSETTTQTTTTSTPSTTSETTQTTTTSTPSTTSETTTQTTTTSTPSTTSETTTQTTTTSTPSTTSETTTQTTTTSTPSTTSETTTQTTTTSTPSTTSETTTQTTTTSTPSTTSETTTQTTTTSTPSTTSETTTETTTTSTPSTTSETTTQTTTTSTPSTTSETTTQTTTTSTPSTTSETTTQTTTTSTPSTTSETTTQTTITSTPSTTSETTTQTTTTSTPSTTSETTTQTTTASTPSTTSETTTQTTTTSTPSTTSETTTQTTTTSTPSTTSETTTQTTTTSTPSTTSETTTQTSTTSTPFTTSETTTQTTTTSTPSTTSETTTQTTSTSTPSTTSETTSQTTTTSTPSTTSETTTQTTTTSTPSTTSETTTQTTTTSTPSTTSETTTQTTTTSTPSTTSETTTQTTTTSTPSTTSETTTQTTTTSTPSTTSETTTQTTTTSTPSTTSETTTQTTTTSTLSTTSETTTQTTTTSTPSTTSETTTQTTTTSTPSTTSETTTETTTTSTPSTTSETTTQTTTTSTSSTTAATSSSTPNITVTLPNPTGSSTTTGEICQNKLCPAGSMVNVSIFDCAHENATCEQPFRYYDNSYCCFRLICGKCMSSNFNEYKPGESYVEGCNNCTCTPEAVLSCVPLPCPYLVPATCTEEGYIPVTVLPDGACCPVSKCEFNETLCDKKPHYCKPGFNPEVPLGGCCTNFTCVPKPVCAKDNAEYPPGSPVPAPPGSCEECKCSDMIDSSTQLYQVICQPIVCNTTCDVGEVYTPISEKCCGRCSQNACVFILPDGSIKTLPSGSSVPLTGDICTTYVCTKENDRFYSFVSHLLCEHNSAEECGLGQEYVKDPGLCCGLCVQKECVFTEKNGDHIRVAEGESAKSSVDSCVTYNCKMSAGTLTPTEVQESCQYETQNDCGAGQTYEPPPAGQCCGKCVKTACAFRLPNGTMLIVNAGDSVLSPVTMCLIYNCPLSAGTLISTETYGICQYNSQHDCGDGQTYQSAADQCCGKCVQTSCIFTLPNGSTQIVNAGDSVPSPADKCVTYNCKQSEGTVISTETHTESCQYQNQSDCGAGETYKPPPADQCCGECVQTSCVFTLPTGATQTVNEGPPVASQFDSCVTYSCAMTEGTLVSTVIQKSCQYSANDCGADEKYQPPPAGQCCGKCVTKSCEFILPDGSNLLLNINDTRKSNDHCTTYSCTTINGKVTSSSTTETCEVANSTDCQIGFTFEKDRDQCCGQCVQDSCVYVTSRGEVQRMKTGDSKPDADDSCTTYICAKDQGVFSTIRQKEKCKHKSSRDCQDDETYVKTPDQCCGYCSHSSCLIKDDRGQKKTLDVGDTFPSPVDKCVSYGCMNSSGQIYTMLFNKTCEIINPKDCETGTVELSSDGCCQVCKAPKTCHVLYNTTVIKKGNCEVEESVPYCTGVCMTMPFTTAPTIPPVDQKCMCCRKSTSSQKTVILKCRDGTTLPTTYEHIDSCVCLECVNS
ncbi:mucin-2-like [Hyperolius riggenbachi]|uniref:mucin-2-like n=1 Tax=Hyperolius riggenbachi TaxID=752182 RepID=UPI0035A2BAF8